jgi:glutamate N-acetyltransferase/amino-acid N-acetyltransferase
MPMVEQMLAGVLESLAKAIARDGEGARKLITIEVTGAPTGDAARQIARSIANSPLVKTAVAGSDANWGRIICAAGNSGVKFDPSTVDIEMQGVVVCRGGLAAPFDEDALKEKLHRPECDIRFVLSGKLKGHAGATGRDLGDDGGRVILAGCRLPVVRSAGQHGCGPKRRQ